MTDEFAVAAIIDRMIDDGDPPMPPDLYERYKIYLRERFPWAGQGPEPEANSPNGKALTVATKERMDQLPRTRQEAGARADEEGASQPMHREPNREGRAGAGRQGPHQTTQGCHARTFHVPRASRPEILDRL
jgi:hypothetical protein